MLRAMTCQCTNVHCSHSFVAHLEAVRTISPSATPHVDVYLPMSDIAKNRLVNQRSFTESGTGAGIRVSVVPKANHQASPR